MIYRLQDLAYIRAGHPFRGSVPAVENGDIGVIQMRDISLDGSVAWSELVRTAIASLREPDWIQSGDVLFAARGAHNYALALEDVPQRSLCSQHFFVLRCKRHDVLPAYLAWHINRAPSQRYLASNAEGSAQLGIRRAVLESMPIALPPLARQEALVRLAAAAVEEKQRYEALIHNREQQLDAMADALLSSSHS